MVHQTPVVRPGYLARAPEAQPSGLTWRRIPAVVSARLDSLTARTRRIATDLTGFIRAERLDGAETEILAAMNDCRELRVMVRQLRAEAKAERRAAPCT